VNNDTLVVFDHVWKKFERGESHTSLRDLIPSIARSAFARRSAAAEDLRQQEFWAVRDVSFSVDRGRAVGIIGPNGAGKSTTLKLLTRILRPTRGHCAIRGRVGALIEVGAGFHPDLTGRENIYLQGAIMGMARAEVTRKLDAIVDFAGVHDFVDTPVKRYSSGMNARLGFSIAANLNPDVLVIDEVLAVGDMAFQQRCLDRLEEFKRNGVAIVFVSHNLQAVASLCERTLLLSGTVRADGPPSDVIRAYVSAARSGRFTEAADDAIEVVSATLTSANRQLEDEEVAPGTALELRVEYVPRIAADAVIFDFLLYRSDDNLMLYEGHYTSAQLGLGALLPGVSFVATFRFAANVVGGRYRVVTRIRETTMLFASRLLSDARRPNMFTVGEDTKETGIAYLRITSAQAHTAIAAKEHRHRSPIQTTGRGDRIER
jgi:homopolymeric O-antigen transport system ATP-binding protein